MGGENRQASTGAERATLTPGAVVRRALSLADMEGLGAVTIRRLAKDLGVTPMALYWHFRNKDELLDGIVNGIFEEIDLGVDSTATWQVQLRELLGSILAVLRTHHATALLVSRRTTTSERGLQATELMLDILRHGGFSPPEATQIARHALSTLTSLVSGMPESPRAEESAEGMHSQRRARLLLESLSPDRFPRLLEAAGSLSVYEDPESHFAFGLDLLLAGIEAMAACQH